MEEGYPVAMVEIAMQEELAPASMEEQPVPRLIMV